MPQSTVDWEQEWNTLVDELERRGLLVSRDPLKVIDVQLLPAGGRADYPAAGQMTFGDLAAGKP